MLFFIAISYEIFWSIYSNCGIRFHCRKQTDYIGDSFKTISSSGFNGAIIHYAPSEETDRPINVNEMYLCDSGGQYL